MQQFKDFDAAWADQDDEPVVLRMLGADWTCKRPSEVPAAQLLRMDRLMLALATGDLDGIDVDDSLTPEGMARALAGDANVDAWIAAGLPYGRLADVARWLTARYKGQDPDADPPQAANRVTRRAAKKKTRSR